MLLLNDIKKLREKTDNINVLKAAFDAGSNNLSYILRIYEMLENDEFKIPQEYRDLLAECYATERLLNDKIAIEKLLSSEDFIKKLASMSIDEVNAYIELCHQETYNDMLTNTSVIKNYSTKAHLEIIKLSDEIRDLEPEIKAIFVTAVNLKQNISTIKIIIKTLKVGLNESNKKLLSSLLTSNDFYAKYNSAVIIEIITAIMETTDIKLATIIATIALNGFWLDMAFSFQNILSLLAQCKENTRYILTCPKVYTYGQENLTQIIELINEYPHLLKYFNNSHLNEVFSFEELISLMDEYSLKDQANFNIFAKVFENIKAEEEKETICSVLKEELDKYLYSSTIGEYLDLCNSIEEFLAAIKPRYDANDCIYLESSLTLTSKE